MWYQKNMGWIVTQAPAVISALLLALFPSEHKLLIQITGYSAVGALAFVLILNPLGRILPTHIWIKKLNRYRREIGVACFSLGVVHIACFFVKHGIPKVFKYFIHPALIPAIFIALPIFFLLTITSNNWSIKKFGFVKWKKLHKMVYVAEVAIFLHMFLVGKKLYAFLIFTPLVALQLIRRHKRKQDEKRKAAAIR